jgi:group I intron endonuclease
MIHTGYIYRITNPAGRIYIGKTTRINDRISYYRSNKNCKQILISRSIAKYGWDKHSFEIIATAPSDQLNELEQKYIQEYNSFHYENKNGMNLTKGGEGTFGRIPTDKQRKKLSESLQGKTHSSETKQLMRSLKIGKPSNFKGYSHTDESRRKIGLANKGHITKQQTIDSMLNTKLNKLLEKHEAILQIDPISNTIVKEWKILPTHIAKQFNTNPTAIRKCLINKNKTSSGYVWRYKK